MTNKPNKIQTAGIVIAFVALLLLVCGGILFFLTHPLIKEKSVVTTPTAPAATVGTVTASADQVQPVSANGIALTQATAAATVKPTEGASAPAKATVPSALQTALSESGYSSDDLIAGGIEQLVTVNSNGGTGAEINFYEYTADGGWQADAALACQGYVGMNGTTAEMSEYITATPQGLYAIGSAFYQNSPPATGLSAFAITGDTYWVDDPDSAHYNQRVVGDDNKDWKSAETMGNISGYRYGFVINYNTPPTGYARGSAIFFHIGDGPTHGCVAASEDMVLAYLAKLDAGKNPYILIR